VLLEPLGLRVNPLTRATFIYLYISLSISMSIYIYLHSTRIVVQSWLAELAEDCSKRLEQQVRGYICIYVYIYICISRCICMSISTYLHRTKILVRGWLVE